MLADKYAVILSNFGNRADRFLSEYGEDKTLSELFDAAASLPDLSGVELVGTWHIRQDNVEDIRQELDRTGLKLVSIIPDHFASKIWAKGALAAKGVEVRRQAIATTIAAMDAAAELGCDLVSLWPGQDGYDYPFQADYIQEHTFLVESIAECARHRSDVRIALEYKPKEPRTHSYLANVSNTLLVVEEVALKNVGVTIDVGHALAAYENVSESIALLARHNDRLFHMHFNDNYRLWDDDMMVGSVHTIEYLEILYWLDRTGYSGYFSMDQYPYREDPIRAIDESLQWLKLLRKMLQRIGHDRVQEVICRGDATEASAMLRQAMSG